MNITELIPQIDALFVPWDKTCSPGCALAVIHEGEIIYKRGYGMASLEFGVPITPQTVFQIGSISKQFTALAIALLAHEGKISLDDDVRIYIPELPDFGDTITIRHLVHHTSGLRGIDELIALAGDRLDDVTLVQDTLGYLALQRSLNFKPGEKFLYCNTGYTLMAQIVERVSAMTMHEFCEQRLFAPLGMRNTIFHDQYKMVVPGFAQSYVAAGEGQFQKECLMHALPGSTSLLTTVEDLLYWDREFYRAQVVGEDVIRQMHQQGVLNNGKTIEYAFGIGISQYRGLKTVSHSGSDAGFRAMLLRFPEQQFSVIILSNLAGFNPSDLAKKVADLCLADQFSEALPVQEKLETISLSETELADKAGLYYNPESELGASYRLEMRAGKLVMDIGPGFEVLPLSADVFVLAGFEVIKMRFEKTAEDRNRMVLLVEDEKIEYPSVEAVSPTQDELQAYTGRYYSPELDSRYEINLKDGRLLFKIKKHGEFQLQPTIRDGFSLDMSALVGAPYSLNVVFDRLDGAISGLKMSSGRAKNVELVRL